MKTQTKLTTEYGFTAKCEDIYYLYGDTIWEKQEGDVRIALQNVRGLGSPPGEEIITVLEDLKIDIFGATEINNNTYTATIMEIIAKLRYKFGAGDMVVSNLNSKTGQYASGGTATIAVGNITGRLTNEKGADKLGTHSWITLRGKNNGGLVIITVYRVGQKAGTWAKPYTHYMKQVKELAKESQELPDPRNQTLVKVTELIAKMRKLGYEPIVMMDANEDYEKDKDARIGEFMEMNDLHDVHRTHLTRLPRNTYLGGTKRLDLTMISNKCKNWVTRCGILPIHEGVVSDHSMQYIDLSMKRAFGHNKLPEITPPQQRQFNLENKPKVAQFLENLKFQFEHQNIWKRVRKLAEEFKTYGRIELNINKYEGLDKEIIEAVKSAAKKVARMQFGYARSEELSKAGESVRMWKAVSTCITNRIPMTHAVFDAAEKTGYDGELGKITKNQARKEYDKARNELKEIQKRAEEVRREECKIKATERAALENEDDTERVLKQMTQRLENTAMNRKLTRIAKGTNSALNYIQVPQHDWYHSEKAMELYHYDNGVFEAHVNVEGTDEYYAHHALKVLPPDAVEVEISRKKNGRLWIRRSTTNKPQWNDIHNKEELETLILQRNKRHYQQAEAEETTPTQPKYKEWWGKYGTTTMADRILEGELTEELENIPEVLKVWIGTLSRSNHNNIPTQPVEGWITKEEFMAAFKAVKERTSSSPSGIHYTFWKAMATDEEISEILALMMSLPFVYGFAPKRWTINVEVMLEKKPGVRMIHLLRIIGILEGDFQTALKILFSKKLMGNAEQHGISPEQFGSRANRASLDAAFGKRLLLDYARTTYMTIALFMNDATACFDRIIPAQSALIARKHGMDSNVLYSRNDVIWNMKRHVKTSHGTSKKFYQQLLNENQILGEVQGKADVPTLWCLLSSTLLQAHKLMCKGVEIKTSTGEVVVQQNDAAFVDDNDTVEGTREFNNEAAEKVRELIEKAAQIWAELIELTGGSIAFHKCKWSMISWDFTKCPPRIRKVPEGEVVLSDMKGARTLIEKQGVNEPNVGLGCRFPMDSNMTKEAEHRTSQCREIAAKMAPEKLTKTEAKTFLMTRVIPIITHSFPVTTFTSETTRTFNKILDPVILPKMGINSKTAKGALYATIRQGGFNHYSFEFDQAKSTILTIIKHMRGRTLQGRVLRAMLSQVQLMAGSTESLIEDTTTNINYVDAGWIQHLRISLQKCNATLLLEYRDDPTLQRKGDKAIMSEFTRIVGITLTRLVNANMVRIYLRVATISDLAHLGGRIIPAGRMSGAWRAESRFDYPDLPKPPEKCWKDFRYCMKQTFVKKQYVIPSQQAELVQPLGHWLETKRNVIYQYHRDEKAMYVKCGSILKVFNKLERKRYVYAEDWNTEAPPTNAHPILAWVNGNEAGTNMEYNMEQSDPPPQQKIPSPTPSITSENLMGTDGSLLPASMKATGAFIIHKEGQRYQGGDKIKGNKYTTSYTTELEAVYRGVRVLNMIHGDDDEEITHSFDNKGGVNKLNLKKWHNSRALAPEADTLLAIDWERQKMKQPMRTTWVKGHQDRKRKRNELSQNAITNCECDELAEQLHENTQYSALERPYNGSLINLKIGNEWVTAKYIDRLKEAFMAPRHREYFTTKYGYSSDVYDTIDWEGIERARKNLTTNQNNRIAKLFNGWLPIGNKLYEEAGAVSCPCCGKKNEYQQHVFQCKDRRMKEVKNNALEAIRAKLLLLKVHRRISGPFIEYLQARMEQRKPRLANDLLPEVAMAIQQQNEIATIRNKERSPADMFLRGCLAKGWIQALEQQTAETAIAQGKALFTSIWITMFEALWEKRNEISHGSNHRHNMRQHEAAEEALTTFKERKEEWLSKDLRFLTNYDLNNMASWTLTTKQEMLITLRTARSNCKAADRNKGNGETMQTNKRRRKQGQYQSRIKQYMERKNDKLENNTRQYG